MNATKFYQLLDAFFSTLKSRMVSQNIELPPHWDIDHICYRVETLHQYEAMKEFLASFSDKLIESPVNGRAISTFKLNESVYFDGRQIDLIELPAPKPDKKIAEGFEHIEVVIDQTFDKIRSMYPGCKFKDSGLNKFFNKELELQLDNYAIKFHQLSLESVINLESNQRVHSAIEGCRVLDLLSEFDPLIAGTFPLKIATNSSDVDILLYSPNLDKLAAEISSHFSQCESFETHTRIENDLEYLIARFNFHGVPFELFGQNIETVEQKAYKHFQVEERLLKLGGQKLRTQIISYRKQGLKTEPAFARALNLHEDPYLKLLELHNGSNSNLIELLQIARSSL